MKAGDIVHYLPGLPLQPSHLMDPAAGNPDISNFNRCSFPVDDPATFEQNGGVHRPGV